MSHALPLLETPRLLLRGARHEDLKTLQEHWNHPLVRQFLFDDKPVDEALAEAVLGTCLSAAQQGHGLWLLTEKASHQFVGCVALIQTSVAAEYEPQLVGHLEPMVSLSPDHWGNGFAAEGLAAVLRYAFERLALPSLAAVNDVPNTASEKMLLNAGFSVLSEVGGPRHRLRTYTLQRQTSLSGDDA